MQHSVRLQPDSALFLDFDGTLAALALRPELVDVDEQVISFLSRINDCLGGAVAILTGRPISQIDGFLHPLALPAAGLHGLEWRSTAAADPVRAKASPDLQYLRRSVEASGLLADGIMLEDKGAAIALHYRSVPHLEGALEAYLARTLTGLPDLHVLRGKMVMEVKPATHDKGLALRQFMELPPFRGRVPVFAGDDVTDEDAMAAALALGGSALKVGEGPTCAPARLPDVAAVTDWLAQQVRHLTA
ncbi:trehalose-phosphatase [Pannonibacter phragmitetus]|uniref:trehalose-phosphatase n=1 Tax=Pannonibacter phragmitetus TaxID=121719 RepID=UPI000F025919|nr:trehalose-phosphatase [Pannonibacter phragmitetus]